VTAAPLRYEKLDRGVACVTLARPDKLNALNMEMRDLLWDALEALRDDPDVNATLFRGEGDRGFSAGADITEFGTAPSFTEARRARQERDVWGLMLSITKPMVAAIHGIAYGAGCELALCCDIRIAADDARLALPEVNLGYIPSAGGTQTLPRLIPPGVAREMVLSGEPIDAQRALAVGLVHRVVPRAELDGAALAVAEQLAAQPPDAVRAAKEALTRGMELPLEQALRLEALLAERLREGLNEERA
jgi:enoyl-CoA hydratase/carnithine racemase